MTDEIFQTIETKTSKNSSPILTVFIFVLLAVSGVLFGFLGSKLIGTKQNGTTTGNFLSKTNNTQSVGVKDTKLFPDSAEGIVKKGGIEGEGSHHLVRKGGKDQYVYLTSSSVDLNQFVDKKVKVWGKTYTAQTAGWLMDVGYVEIQ